MTPFGFSDMRSPSLPFRLLLCCVLLGALPGHARAQGDDAQISIPGGKALHGVVLPGGTADHLSLKDDDGGGTFQVIVTPNTRIARDRNPVRAADIKPGETVLAFGTFDAPSRSLHALFVSVLDPAELKRAKENLGKTYITGTVVSIEDLKLVIRRPDGVRQTIAVDEGTSFRRGGRRAGATAGISAESDNAVAAASGPSRRREPHPRRRQTRRLRHGRRLGQRRHLRPHRPPRSRTRQASHPRRPGRQRAMKSQHGFRAYRVAHRLMTAGGRTVLMLLAFCAISVLSSAQTPAAPAPPTQTPAQLPANPATPAPAAPRQSPPDSPSPSSTSAATPTPEPPLPAPTNAVSPPLMPASAPTTIGTIRGIVRSGVTPLPGVTVTATNTLTGQRITTATDLAGGYVLHIPRTGRYVVRAEFAAFSPVTQEVLLTGAPAPAANSSTASPAVPSSNLLERTADLTLELLSRAQAREAAATSTASGAGARGGGAGVARGSGMQSLNLFGDLSAAGGSSLGSGAGAGLPALPSAADASATESVAVNGQMGQTNGLANFSEDDVRDRINDALAQARRQGGATGDIANAVAGMIGGMLGPGGGGFGGGGGRGGPGGFGGGRGGFGRLNPTQPHGSIFYQGGNGALDATNFSLSGRPIQPAYNNNRYGVSFAGSPYILGLTKPSTKQFVFLNVTGQRNINPINLNGTVPTIAERAGDFSALTQTVNGVPTPTLIYDPTTGQPFPGNQLTRISPQAQALLASYPAPNVPQQGVRGYNYQNVTTAGQNSTSAALRFTRSFGASNSPFGSFGGRGGGGGRSGASNALRQSINFNGSYAHSASDLRPLLPAGGGSQASDGYGLTAGYTVARGRLSNNASLNWNRSHSTTTNYFTDTSLDPATAAGVSIPSRGVLGGQSAFYNGLPNLTISNFSPLSEQTPRDAINQTISVSDFVAWRHGKHNMRAGIDVRRVHADSLGGNNVAGTFLFSGFNTESPRDQNTPATGNTAQPTTGAGFADFLLGLPQSTRIQSGLSKIYLRANVYDWYLQDDFRVLPSLTLNAGLRYEYFSPYVEKNNRLVNLDHNADFSVVTPVQPGQTSSFGNRFPRSLVNPDRTLFSPRFGLAWRPPSKNSLLKNTVVRAGYGINYNTGQFATFAQSLSFQPPFAITQTNVLSTIASPTGCTLQTLTLASGFGCSAKTIQNNYAVNPDYRLGRVQVYNVDIQRTFPLGIVLNVGYNGSVGGNLDILEAPNHTTSTVTTTDAQAFTYENSVAQSRFSALTVNARKRMQKGISLQATYTYGHSIDNASTIGGTGNGTIVQNDQRLDLEFGNSNFDHRHSLTGNWVAELPFGPNRLFFTKGDWRSKLTDGLSLSGDFTFQSGTFFTPTYSADASQIAAGGNYTLRPDRVFSQPIAGPGSIRQWFNPNAFTAPAGFGTASRNSIAGPGTLGIETSLSRTASFGDTRSFEARVTAQNVFNTVQYNGINTDLSSATFGQVTGTANARRLLFVARYRF